MPLPFAVTPKFRFGTAIEKHRQSLLMKYVWFDGNQNLHSPGDGRAV